MLLHCCRHGYKTQSPMYLLTLSYCCCTQWPQIIAQREAVSLLLKISPGFLHIRNFEGRCGNVLARILSENQLLVWANISYQPTIKPGQK